MDFILLIIGELLMQEVFCRYRKMNYKEY